jgi:hypothetical protein
MLPFSASNGPYSPADLQKKQKLPRHFRKYGAANKNPLGIENQKVMPGQNHFHRFNQYFNKNGGGDGGLSSGNKVRRS